MTFTDLMLAICATGIVGPPLAVIVAAAWKRTR